MELGENTHKLYVHDGHETEKNLYRQQICKNQKLATLFRFLTHQTLDLETTFIILDTT